MNIQINLWGFISFATMIVYFLLDKYYVPLRLSKKQFIYKLQFEKEFKIYSELWEKLIELRNTTELYLLTDKSIDQNKPEESAGVKKIKVPETVAKLYDETVKMITNNKPFYSDSVYKKATKLLSRSLKELFGFGHPIEDILEGEKSVNEKISEMNEIIENVEKAIRRRIDFIEKFGRLE